ncbi:MAG: hypothetical protein Q8920_15785 [Bacillota bacterium]|nr:hypothetical protein [Bacillota bacterium]
MRVSAIEIGTNSTKFIIAEPVSRNNYKVITKKSTVNRLSKDMYGSNLLSGRSIDTCTESIREYLDESRKNGARLLSIFSTSVLRDAGNKQEVINRIKSISGMDVDIISGEREALLTYKACCSLKNDTADRFAIIDIGGGSTEIITGGQDGIDNKISLDIGAVRLTEMFIKNDPVEAYQIEDIRRFAMEKLRSVSITSWSRICLVGTGGTVKTAATMCMKTPYDNESGINGLQLSKESISGVFNKLAAMTVEQRKNVVGLNPKRADVINTGLMILICLLDLFKTDRIVVSSRGVLEGFIDEYTNSI